MTTTAATATPEPHSGPRAFLYFAQFPGLVILPAFGSVGRAVLGSAGWMSVFYLMFAALPMLVLQVVVLVLTMKRAGRVGRHQVGRLTAWSWGAYVVGSLLGPLGVDDASDTPGRTPSVLELHLGVPQDVSTALFVVGTALTVVAGVAMVVTAALDLRAATPNPFGPSGNPYVGAYAGPYAGPHGGAVQQGPVAGGPGSIVRTDAPRGAIERADPVEAPRPVGGPGPAGTGGPTQASAEPLQAEPLQARPLQAQPLQARPLGARPSPARESGGAGTATPGTADPGTADPGTAAPGAGRADTDAGSGPATRFSPPVPTPHVADLPVADLPVTARSVAPSSFTPPSDREPAPPSSMAPTAPLAPATPIPPTGAVPAIGPLGPAGPVATEGSVAPVPSDALNAVEQEAEQDDDPGAPDPTCPTE